MKTFRGDIVLLTCIVLAGCAPHPKEAAQNSSKQTVALPRVATCPTNTPMVEEVMAALRTEGTHPQMHILSTTGLNAIYVFPDESAKARELIASLAKEDKFQGLKVAP